MTLTNITECPICGNNQLKEVMACVDYTTTHESFNIGECSNCKFWVTNPQPNQDSIGKYYLSENYISHTDKKQTLFDKAYSLVRNISIKWKKRIVVNNSNSGNTILDFGSGTGNFLLKMKNSNWTTVGIESSEKALEKALKKNVGKIHSQLAHLQENSFDVITLWHVLEHVVNLNETLKSLHTLLNKSGTIIIAVPNRESYDANYYQSYWAGYDVPRHLWHFSQENMKSILEKSGFKLVKTLAMPIDSFYVSLLSESYKNPDRWKIINAINAFKVGLVSNLKALKATNYSSLIYIAKK